MPVLLYAFTATKITEFLNNKKKEYSVVDFAIDDAMGKVDNV